MANLGIVGSFAAEHGSRRVRKDEFRVEISFQGPVRDNFVRGIDYLLPKARLDSLAASLEGKYLDDIIGRATNERIALHILHAFNDLPVHAVRVAENGQYAEVTAQDMPDNYPAHREYELARSFLFRGRTDDALDAAGKAIGLKPDFAEAYNLRGRCHKSRERYDLALPEYLRAASLKPDFGEAYRNMGNAHLYLGEFDKMTPAFSRAIELMPDSAVARNNRGFAYQKTKQFELAIEDHTQALSLDPEYAEAYDDRAEAYAATGRDVLAAQDRTTAASLRKSGKDSGAPEKARMY